MIVLYYDPVFGAVYVFNQLLLVKGREISPKDLIQTKTKTIYQKNCATTKVRKAAHSFRGRYFRKGY